MESHNIWKVTSIFGHHSTHPSSKQDNLTSREGRGMGQVSRKTVWVHQILSSFLHWTSFYCVCFLSSVWLEDVSIYPLEAFTTEDHGPKFQNSNPWGLESSIIKSKHLILEGAKDRVSSWTDFIYKVSISFLILSQTQVTLFPGGLGGPGSQTMYWEKKLAASIWKLFHVWGGWSQL